MLLKKNVSFSATASEIRAVLRIFLLSGYRPVPARRLYWSSDEDVRSDFVADAISRHRFEQIMSFLHFTDKMKLDKNDKLAKLRPLIKYLNEIFATTFPMEQQIDLDESMNEYFGKHGCNQCKKNKPIRFGYKAWCLNSKLGYLFAFDIYQGSSSEVQQHYEAKFDKGGGILLSLLDSLPDHITKLPLRVYLDNYFTSLPLIAHLASKHYGATGTVRDNRIPKTCPIMSTKDMKKQERGSIDSVVNESNKISLIRWADNAVVTVASNIHSTNPTVRASRWSSKCKKTIQVNQPYVINAYNKFMGGTDRMDQNVNCYRVNIRMKKWWWPIFSWLLDVTV